jgi:hypothetical protein
MHWSDLDLRPDDRKLRQFTILAAVVLGVFAVVRYIKAGTSFSALIFAVAAVIIAGVGLAAPRLIRPLYVALTVATFPIGWVVSRLVLLVIFYVVITPIGLLLRFTGYDSLRLKRRSVDSHWEPKKTPRDVMTYVRQF